MTCNTYVGGGGVGVGGETAASVVVIAASVVVTAASVAAVVVVSIANVVVASGMVASVVVVSTTGQQNCSAILASSQFLSVASILAVISLIEPQVCPWARSTSGLGITDPWQKAHMVIILMAVGEEVIIMDISVTGPADGDPDGDIVMDMDIATTGSGFFPGF